MTNKRFLTQYDSRLETEEIILKIGYSNHADFVHNLCFYTSHSSTNINRFRGVLFDSSYEYVQNYFTEEVPWTLLDIKEVEGTDHLITLKTEGGL